MMYVKGYYGYLIMSINTIHPMSSTIYCNGKRKTIPKESWTDPEGSRRLKLPDFRQSAH